MYGSVALWPRALVAVFAAVAIGLGGCSDDDSGGGSESLTATPSTDVKATLTVWSYLSLDSQKAMMQGFERQFQRRYPNVKFEYLYTPFADLRNKVLTGASRQKGPDVLVFDPADTVVLAKAGAIADLSEGWDAFRDRDEFADALVWKYRDRPYAVQAYVNTTALWYNREILKKAGITPPRTIEELDQALTKVDQAGHEGFALCGAPTTECETQALSWILGQGGNYDKLDEAATVFDRFAAWREKGFIPKSAATWGQTDAFESFLGGDTAFVQAGNWELGHAKEDANFQYGIVPLPGARVAPGGEGEAVGGFSGNKALAWEYLKSTWFTSEGQLSALEKTGSIPSRRDAGSLPQVQDNELLAPYATEITDAGARPPVQDGDIQKATTVMGEVWSSVLSGQLDAQQAIERLKSEIGPLFGTS